MNKETFSERLLTWFKDNKRVFPWRERREPYAVLIAEVLLRKTDAPKVLAVYEGFLTRYPNFEEVASAPVKELIEVLKPLGLYRRRANELKGLAKSIVKEHKGRLPRSKKELIKLPGVGNYIANAVLCFAFNEDVPLLDSNIIRVLERVFSLKSFRARPRTDKELWEAAGKIIPKNQAKDFNLALLDFAAQICTARNPKCDLCFFESLCEFRAKSK